MTHPMLGTVAPVIPEFGYLVGLFFAIVGVVLARGALATWTHSFGYLFQWLARELKFEIGTWLGTIKIDLGGPFHAVDGWVKTALRAWLEGSEHEMTYFLHGSAVLWDWTVAEIEKLGHDSVGWAKWSQHVFVPAFVHALVYPLTQLVKGAKSVAADAERLGLRGLKWSREFERTLPHRFIALLRKYAAVAIPGVGALPWLIPEVRTLNRRWQLHLKRILRLEKLLTTVGLATAVAAMLGLPNWRCLTRGNIGRGARFFCGLDSWLVNFLLLGTLEAFVVSDLCRFTDLLGKEAEKIRPALMKLVDVEDALIGCHGTVKPIDFKLPPLSLPPMPGASALAA